MIIFKNIYQDKTFALLDQAATLSQSPLEARARTAEIAGLITDAAADILAEAEACSLEGNLWHTFLTLRLCEDENILGRAAELDGMPSGTLAKMALEELTAICGAVKKIQEIIESDETLQRFKPFAEYVPSRKSAVSLDDESKTLVSTLAEKIFAAFAAPEPKRALAQLLSFYMAHGSGIFALNRAFKWREKTGSLAPISDLEKYSLKSLIGYEEQKTELLANTEQFLAGKTANNVLLFGDSGTGKSSSVKALLNEPGFVRRGLRMIEVHKEQYREIAEILNQVRDRNYRFILFMDDLSFEEFEVEYKYLKAIIEGGLERKPDNVLIYATSNRRNLVREVWKDRKATSDDVHGWDTMQEKHSLADRFGVTIWYGSAEKDLYLEMIHSMAKEEDLSIPKEELERMALQWEVGRGGYTGRTARQFVQYARHLAMGGDSK